MVSIRRRVLILVSIVVITLLVMMMRKTDYDFFPQDILSNLSLPSFEPNRPIQEVAQSVNTKPEENVQQEALLPLVTIVGPDDMKALRELVGSVHFQREDNTDIHTIIVYGMDLTNLQRNEILLWRNVLYHDMEHTFTLSGSAELSHELWSDRKLSPLLMANLFDLVLRERPMFLYVSVQFHLAADKLHDMARSLNRQGFVFLSHSDPTPIYQQLDSFVKEQGWFHLPAVGFKLKSEATQFLLHHPLQCMRGYQCREGFLPKLRENQRRLLEANKIQTLDKFSITTAGAGKFYCNILLRDDALYEFDLRPHDASQWKTDKIRIAFGMPSISVGLTSPLEVAPLRLFLKTFLASVLDTEWRQYSYRVYIGYDEGDRFYDNEQDRKIIQDAFEKQVKEFSSNADVSVDFVRFPFSKGWVTFLWNGLFARAVHDGADYFYQINDDVTLDSQGWTTKFVSYLKSNNNVGMTGPGDPNHGRDLLTQAFAHRTHYEIFGRFYPLDIKDWYSDDFVSEVYGPQFTRVHRDHRIHNVNDRGTRYENCLQPNYKRFLEKGKNIFQKWKADSSNSQILL